jgi:hypothetical protein
MLCRWWKEIRNQQCVGLVVLQDYSVYEGECACYVDHSFVYRIRTYIVGNSVVIFVWTSGPYNAGDICGCLGERCACACSACIRVVIVYQQCILNPLMKIGINNDWI